MNYQHTTLKEFVGICQLKRCFEQQIGQHNCSVVFSAKFIDASWPDYVGLDLNDRQISVKYGSKNIKVRIFWTQDCENGTAVT